MKFNHKVKVLCMTAIVCAILICGSTSLQARPEWSPLLGKMAKDSLDSHRNIAVLVFLSAPSVADDMHSIESRRSLNRAERILTATQKLNNQNAPASAKVARFLESCSSTPVRKLWITPAFAATIPADKLDRLSEIDGIQLIIPDVDLELVAPVEESPAPSLVAAIPGVLSQMNVPTVWRRGLTGKGRLICSFDTGVQGSHPALASKWRGNRAALHSAWFSTIAPDTLPYDKAGHGTHTMGIMVGSTDVDSFGVAPGAEWITAGVIDQGKSLNLTIADILFAFQWALDPDGNPATTDDVPDVILNSWGIPKGIFPACDPTFSGAIANVEAAGIVTVFAAGNEGPNPSTLRQPADNATSPLNTFSVGAVDSFLNVAAFSSRGPSYCDASQMKPEIVAPGVAIRSCTKGSAYTYMSGTSMAAPFVAGVVALLREYNPDATVDEIKQALISSARDIGAAGEDNASGYGFVDAAGALEYMPLPMATIFTVAHKQFTSSTVAMPGQTVGLSLTLTNSTGRVGQISGRLVPLASGIATMQSDLTTFNFGVGGTTALASPELSLTFDSDLPHGTQAPFRLYLESAAGMLYDSLDLTLICGISPTGSVASHVTPEMTVGVSDFGQFGLSEGSIYNVGGAGFHYQGGANLLYEAGVIIARNGLQVSSAVRDSAGHLRTSDFVPTAPLTSATGSSQDQHLTARLVDSRSAIPIPITINQETVSQSSISTGEVLIVKYRLVNNSPDKLTNLRLGFLSDFDLSSGDTVGYSAATNMIWQTTAGGPFVGIVALHNIANFRSLANGSTKTGYTKSELYNLISTSGPALAASPGLGDQMFLVASGAIDLFSGDSSEVAFAMVVASDYNSLLEKAAQAQTLYFIPTDVDDPTDQLPSTFALDQNYPNPFNPSTTISFALAKPSHVTLRVFNTLGQQVCVLADGPMTGGRHTLVWDGRASDGAESASGVYFYSLTSDSRSETRKMVLVR